MATIGVCVALIIRLHVASPHSTALSQTATLLSLQLLVIPLIITASIFNVAILVYRPVRDEVRQTKVGLVALPLMIIQLVTSLAIIGLATYHLL